MGLAELITALVAVVTAIGVIFITIFRDKFSSKKELIEKKSSLKAIKHLAENKLIEPEQIRKLVIDLIEKVGE